MRLSYPRIRIFLLTLAFALFVMSVIDRLTCGANEICVDVPKIESGSPIIVYPRTTRQIPIGGGGG